MEAPIVGALLACAGGAALAVGNDYLTRLALKRDSARLIALFAVRQSINVSYLVALYFLSAVLPWGMAPMLLGGALGITVPALLLAVRLTRRRSAQSEQAAAQDGKIEERKERA